VNVLGILSHFLWNSNAKKLFSLARYSNVIDLMLSLGKSDRMYS
jgi:hypothetical protein